MKITYIAHSSFLVETEAAVLLFDYTEGELPKAESGKPWYIFASHVHGDHFSPCIFDIPRRLKVRCLYILSYDIQESRVPEMERNQVIFMESREKIMVDGMWVETLKSTDEGVAFLITLPQGPVLYHAGDLNDWIWEGEDPQWNLEMEKSYRAALDTIKGRHIDAAFVPVDPRLASHACDGAELLAEAVTIAHLFPMHCWEKYDVVARLKQRGIITGKGCHVADINKRGQVFEIDPGKDKNVGR